MLADKADDEEASRLIKDIDESTAVQTVEAAVVAVRSVRTCWAERKGLTALISLSEEMPLSAPTRT